MQKLVQHSSIGVAVVLCKARIEVFPGRVAADRMQKGFCEHSLNWRKSGKLPGVLACKPAAKKDPAWRKDMVLRGLRKGALLRATVLFWLGTGFGPRVT